MAQVTEEWVVRSDYSANFAASVTDEDGNIYITGSEGGITTTKFNSLGEEQWVSSYVGMPNGYDRSTSIAIDRKGNVYVTGYTSEYNEQGGTAYNYLTIKYNALGEEQWVAKYI